MKMPPGCMGLQPSKVKGNCAMGADIRPGSYDISVAEIARPSKGMVVPRLVFYGKVDDETAAKFVCEQYNVRAVVIDSRPDATIASRFQVDCKKNGIKCWRAQYSPAPTNRRITTDEGEGLITLDRTQTLDSVFTAFAEGVGISIPQNYREICMGQFAAELCDSNREPVVWHGIPCFAWKNSGDDHAFHSLNYLMLAIELGKLDAGSPDILLPQKGIVEGGAVIDDDDDNYEDAKFWRRGGVVHES